MLAELPVKSGIRSYGGLPLFYARRSKVYFHILVVFNTEIFQKTP